MKTTRIIYDGTNPENFDEMLYLYIVELDPSVEGVEMDRRDVGTVPYVYLPDHPDLKAQLEKPLATLSLDLTNDIKDLIKRAPEQVLKHYCNDDGSIDEDNQWAVAVQTLLLEIMAVTGAEYVHWPYI